MEKKTSLRLSQAKLDRLKELADSKDLSFNDVVNKALEIYYLIESNVDRDSEVFIHNPKNSDKDLILPAGKHSLG